MGELITRYLHSKLQKSGQKFIYIFKKPPKHYEKQENIKNDHIKQGDTRPNITVITTDVNILNTAIEKLKVQDRVKI